MPLKAYTRVWLIMPITEKTIKRIDEIVTEFVKKYKGGTRSQARIPAEFIGYYIPQEEDIIIEDYVVLMFFDIDISEQTNFIQDLERFKREKEGIDKELGEEEIYITIENIYRVV